MAHSYTLTTNFITITVTPEYEEELSMPFDNYYVWDYHINIRNNNIEPVKLINRRWVIIDDVGHIQEVAGAGVVGVQPMLKPGEEFEYSSSVHLNRPSGVMMGKYEMAAGTGENIDVEIPTFSLDCPHIKKSLN